MFKIFLDKGRRRTYDFISLCKAVAAAKSEQFISGENINWGSIQSTIRTQYTSSKLMKSSYYGIKTTLEAAEEMRKTATKTTTPRVTWGEFSSSCVFLFKPEEDE